jgi:hypothetical protein
MAAIFSQFRVTLFGNLRRANQPGRPDRRNEGMGIGRKLLKSSGIMEVAGLVMGNRPDGITLALSEGVPRQGVQETLETRVPRRTKK